MLELSIARAWEAPICLTVPAQTRKARGVERGRRAATERGDLLRCACIFGSARPQRREGRACWADGPTGCRQGVSRRLSPIWRLGIVARRRPIARESRPADSTFPGAPIESREISAIAHSTGSGFSGRPIRRHSTNPATTGDDPARREPACFRPARPVERLTERARLGIAADEIMVLCVGRLSHHAKAHPYPAFIAAAEAARRTGQKIVLVFAGSVAHPAIDRAFREGAKQFNRLSRVLFVDGIDPNVRTGSWRAADVFLSLPQYCPANDSQF